MDPNINGRQTGKQNQQIKPGQKAIISGFAQTQEVKKAQLPGADRAYQKVLYP